MNKADSEFIKEIKEQYPSLKAWSDDHALELYKRIEEHQLIKEFNYTVDEEKTIEHIQRQIGSGVQVEEDLRGISITYDALKKDLLEKVNKIMDAFGWYPATVRGSSKDLRGKYSNVIDKVIGKYSVEIVYEAKYGIKVVPRTKYAYHITPDLKWNGIRALGLTPKTQAKLSNHPGRIYLLTGNVGSTNVDQSVKDLSQMLLNTYKNKDRVEQMYVLRVDLSQLKNHTFFLDPNYGIADTEGIWTYQNIPPSAISISDKIDVS